MSSWFHLSCTNLTKQEFNEISDKEWFCVQCTKDHVTPVNSSQPLLPPHVPCKDIESAVWGELKGQQIYDKLNTAYNTVVTWKRNLFKIPKGKFGKLFVSELGNLIKLWTEKSKFESVALTALHVFIPLMLQKPSRRSKNRDHIRYLSQRIQKWKQGDLTSLVTEGSEIQKRL